jgi:4-nitrophenyl phosphatase
MKEVKKLIYIIDMDGTLYHGNSPIEHAKEFIQYLQQNNRKFILATNCPGNSPAGLVAKLSSMGIEVNESNILTSGQVTAAYIAENKIASKVYLIGSQALEEELIKKGIQVVQNEPDCVVVGFDRDFTYEKMKKAVGFILGGASFIATNCDYTIPEGELIVPHTGALSAGIEIATGVKPLILGKPEKYILEEVQHRLICCKEECCIIGDRLDTDIATGIRFGVNSYLVMTGVTGYDLLKESEIQPTRVFKDLKELMVFDREGSY